jgi:hypothetical protein
VASERKTRMDEVDLCNPDMHGYCRCPVPVNTGPFIINKKYTYYPKAGMISCAGQVFQTTRPLADNEWGPHFIKDVLQIKDREGMRIAVYANSQCWAIVKPDQLRGGKLLLQDVFPCIMHPLYLVRKIQTWVRRALKTRRQTRKLAFAMGTHARLGCQSVVMGLHADNLQLIL